MRQVFEQKVKPRAAELGRRLIQTGLSRQGLRAAEGGGRDGAGLLSRRRCGLHRPAGKGGGHRLPAGRDALAGAVGGAVGGPVAPGKPFALSRGKRAGDQLQALIQPPAVIRAQTGARTGTKTGTKTGPGRPRHSHGDPVVPGGQVLRRLASAADDEPGLRPRHRYIKQPRPFLLLPCEKVAARAGDEVGTFGGGGAPERRAVGKVDLLPLLRARFGGIGHDDHGGFQTLGAMHRHHPDASSRRVHLPLDLHIAGGEPADEALKARHLRLLVGQRLREKGVDPVLRLRPQPRQKPAPPAVAGQDAFGQLIGPQEVRLVAQIVQHRKGRPVPLPLPPQSLPEKGAAPRLRQPVEIALPPAEQRRAERGGQRQVILRRDEEGEQRRQIADGHFGGELQPVRPGDRKAGLLAGADDLAKERVPAAHEDEHVPLRHRMGAAIAFGDQRARVYQPPDLSRDHPGKPRLVMLIGDEIDGFVPDVLLRVARLGHQRPQVHPSRHVVLEGDVAHVAAKPLAAIRRESRVHHAEDGGGGTEGMGERQFHQRHLDPRETLAELLPHRLEHRKIGPLEGVDRLFLVAHDEKRARRLHPCAFARGELFRQPFNHRPLAGAGVLRLVHEDMVDPAVQPEQHPLRGGAVRQQGAGAGDEVVEVEPAALPLAPVVFRQEGSGETVERRGALRRDEGEAPGPRRLHPLHQILQHRHARHAGAGGLGGEAADLGGERLLCRSTGQEHALQRRERAKPHRVEPRGAELRCGGQVRCAASLQRRDQLPAEVALIAQTDIGQHICGGECLRQTKEREGRPAVQRIGEGCTVLADLGHQIPQAVPGPERGHPVHGGDMAGIVGQRLDHLLAQKLCRTVVDLAELRGDPGFQRKAAEQRGAEGVDRLDLQTARGFDRAGEKAARAPQPLRADLRRRNAELQQRLAKRPIPQHRPFAQTVKQAVLHLARRGLGIGQAEDALRLHPVQQEPRHPVRQHAGLAGARVGRKPCGGAGVGGIDLPLAGCVAAHRSSFPFRGAWGVASPGSLPVSPARLVGGSSRLGPASAASRPTSSGSGTAVISHSPKRARWS